MILDIQQLSLYSPPYHPASLQSLLHFKFQAFIIFIFLSLSKRKYQVDHRLKTQFQDDDVVRCLALNTPPREHPKTNTP